MYDDAIRVLSQHGFRQYEISNFALPCCECRHNLGYWRQVPYLGLGASAASMLPSAMPGTSYQRITNPRTISSYLSMVQREAWRERECEPVSPLDAQFETWMLGLRTTAGVSEQAYTQMHGVSPEARYGRRLRSLEARGLLLHDGDYWRLTRRGMDIQNQILVELMDD